MELFTGFCEVVIFLTFIVTSRYKLKTTIIAELSPHEFLKPLKLSESHLKFILPEVSVKILEKGIRLEFYCEKAYNFGILIVEKVNTVAKIRLSKVVEVCIFEFSYSPEGNHR